MLVKLLLPIPVKSHLQSNTIHKNMGLVLREKNNNPESLLFCYDA